MIGSFMSRVFTVSDNLIYTPRDLKGEVGSDWATHELIGRRPRAQWVGPKLRSYTFDILLRAQDGVQPRSTLRWFEYVAEREWSDWFIIGGIPLSVYPFRLVNVSEEWGAGLQCGTLIEWASLSIEECTDAVWPTREIKQSDLIEEAAQKWYTMKL